MNQRLLPVGVLLMLLLAVSVSFAQFRRRSFGDSRPPEGVRTAREAARDSPETPDWKIAPEFRRDVFTFARVRYTSADRGWRRGGEWWIDTPDSDLNFSFRLQQMTSLKVDPNGRFIELTDPELSDYPWIYIVEPGALVFSEAEVTVLRRYLLNGGFLMVDDFWGERQWENFRREIRRVFPEREPEELEMSHPIFHCVFDIRLTKQQMQIPNFVQGERSQYDGVTWEYHDGEECREVHFKAIFDDKGRMMVFIAHNTDNGDGWEREGEYEYFFREFSEKKAYPLGINIVFYAMTH
jgi:Domain of unknown function (DUF4159)